MLRFKCAQCDSWHEGEPSFVFEAPAYYYDVAEAEREKRCDLGTDDCVIDEKYFFIKGCLDIPVQDTKDALSFVVWVSLSYESFKQFVTLYYEPERSGHGPYFGWLSTAIPGYPDTVNLKTSVRLRDNGIRPLIELEKTAHPLAIDQSHGVSIERLADIYAFMTH